MSNLDERLRAAISLRDSLSAKASRIAGKKEAAEKALEEVRSEIVSKKLDPDTLDSTIERLEEAYAAAVQKFEEEVNAAQEALRPYMEN